MLVTPLTYGEGLAGGEFLATLARHVLAWNWVDWQGQPLPCPRGNSAALEALTEAELLALAKAVRGRSEAERDELRLQLRSALWVGGGKVPGEWTELQLCRDVYHCTPSQLRRESLDDVLTHLALLSAEAEVQELSGKTSGGKRGRVNQKGKTSARAKEQTPGGQPGHSG